MFVLSNSRQSCTVPKLRQFGHPNVPEIPPASSSCLQNGHLRFSVILFPFGSGGGWSLTRISDHLTDTRLCFVAQQVDSLPVSTFPHHYGWSPWGHILGSPHGHNVAGFGVARAPCSAFWNPQSPPNRLCCLTGQFLG